MTYMDAIQYYCEQNNIELETIGKLVQGALKQRVREEADCLDDGGAKRQVHGGISSVVVEGRIEIK